MDAQKSYLDLVSFGDLGWGDELLAGLWLTIRISICAYLVGMVLGLIGAGAKLSGSRVARGTADLYTTIVRAVPELLLIILIYYTGTSALSQMLASFGLGEAVEVDAFAAAVAALGFITGAYMTEVFRGAILAVPKGQMEAARAYGMPPVLRFRRILFPQLMRYALPGLNNLWLVVTKDSSLISVVGAYELLFNAKQAAGQEKYYMFFYSVAALLFLVLTIASMLVSDQLERRAQRGQRRA
jgi:polar amino acid transport system permease protein